MMVDKDGNFLEHSDFKIYLSGSHEEMAAISFRFFPQQSAGISFRASAWMDSIDLEILEEVEKTPSKFGLNEEFIRSIKK